MPYQETQLLWLGKKKMQISTHHFDIPTVSLKLKSNLFLLLAMQEIEWKNSPPQHYVQQIPVGSHDVNYSSALHVKQFNKTK